MRSSSFPEMWSGIPTAAAETMATRNANAKPRANPATMIAVISENTNGESQ